ncbi:Insulinase (Peptidase M16) [Irineochytrium annulatum]|nr:Insulinase (Peptidase M16) [Irineochytrium annulatum]
MHLAASVMAPAHDPGSADAVLNGVLSRHVEPPDPEPAPGNDVNVEKLAPAPTVGTASDAERRHSVFIDIVKPDIDDRVYRIVTLQNGMDVLVVSDPSTDRSSAALDVRVGHLSDPDSVNGAAHFLEHMLFLGTEKYPGENDYSQFLSEVGGGYSNAFTSAENTNFFFEVSSDGLALEGALDRFAQFFISPLFDESCTERELRAVDSEHKRNMQDDSWRLQQLDQDLSNPLHPYRKFGTGSWETLKEIPEREGINIRAVLLDFHEKYYSANIMKLVVLGKEPIDVLERWAVEKFSPVRNMGTAVPTFPGHPLTAKELGKVIMVKPVKDLQSLNLTFPFPDTSRHYIKSPQKYINHMIGHEGAGSVLSLLKGKGWANGLACWTSHEGEGFEFCKISVDLTDEGMEFWQEIVVILFQYIRMMNENGVIERIYEECKIMAMLSFRYQEKVAPSDFTSWVSQNLHVFAKEHILSGHYLMDQFDESLIRSLLSLLRPDNFRVTLVSTAHEVDDTWSKAPWYGTEYKVLDMEASLLESLRSAELHPELFPPEPNPYIPREFIVHTPPATEGDATANAARPFTPPTVILETPTIRLWHKLDDVHGVPRTSVRFMIRTPHAYASPRCSVLTRLYVDLVCDDLNEDAYEAEMAGLAYGLDTLAEGFELCVEGYTDKMGVLLERIAETMKDLDASPERFKAIKEELLRSYKNFDTENPDQHASYFVNWLLQEKLHLHHEKLAELDSIAEEDVIQFANSLLLPTLHLECLVHGTLTAQQSIDLVSKLESALAPRPLPLNARSNILRTFILPTACGVGDLMSPLPAPAPVTASDLVAAIAAKPLPRLRGGHTYRRALPSDQNVNNAVEYYLQVCDAADHLLRARLLVFEQLASEPCFDQLRTKEQLGYVAWCSVRSSATEVGFRVLVQSEKNPAYLEERIEAFLARMRMLIVEMDDDEYKRNVDTLAAKLLQTDKNQHETTSRLWTAIETGSYDFESDRRDAERVRGVSKVDLVRFYDERIDKHGTMRRKLSVQIWSKGARERFDAAGGIVETAPVEVNKVEGTAEKPMEVQATEAVVVNGTMRSETAVGDGKVAEAAVTREVEEDTVAETEEAAARWRNGWMLSRGAVSAADVE